MVSKRSEVFADPGKREGGKSLGGCHQHPSRVSWEVQAGGRNEGRRMVNGLLGVERRGG